MASIHRQPFGEIGASRLQGLNAQKNCQNAITDLLSKPTTSDKPKPVLTSPTKRPYTPIFEDFDDDSENVDPALLSSKRSKALDGSSKPHFRLNTTFSDLASKPFAGFTSLSDKPTTPSSPLGDKFSFSSLPSGASSAPAGRSPKHKRVGILSKKRSTASPIRRIDPPRFAASTKSSTGLPFSIDAALSGTLSSSSTSATAQKVPITPAVEEPMPTGWFFDIHEDTPEEEAANLMEHSTCILDISSDDEAGPAKLADDRGKENMPPPDHEAEGSGNSQTSSEGVKPRRSVHVDAMVDDGQERAPLGMLCAEDFYDQGLDARSEQLVAETAEPVDSAASLPQPEEETAPGNVASADLITVHEDESAETASVENAVVEAIS